jgi:predicted Rossmann-fold nucleotide-binding protein
MPLEGERLARITPRSSAGSSPSGTSARRCRSSARPARSRRSEYETARSTARHLGEDGFTIITGGGPGIMEAANRGARDAGALSRSG